MFSTENIREALRKIEQRVEMEHYSSAIDIFYNEIVNSGIDELQEELEELENNA